ncbi:uncharacterized protein LOC127078927 [Lathyrus oleraceus]|uniref:uncharacterized protein LOC127078927 n=1 Tax=Pisum sativum TaxID=3888 RepID=UPI001FC3E7F5|nr:uncharacterized protein LOC127078927 [Pisum sativum]
MHWLRAGDLNTKFFHLSATVRRSYQKIDMIKNGDEEEIRHQEGMCEIVKNYFKNLFTVRLLRPVSKEELHEAIPEMHPDKSPGPEDFNPTFYQKLWGTCIDDIFEAVKHWLDMGSFPPALSETNICLIPKCIKPRNRNDLRPILLCNMVYKLFSKMMANRRRKCLSKCVSKEQSTFVEGRFIIDNAMIAIEVIHALKRKTQGNVA